MLIIIGMNLVNIAIMAWSAVETFKISYCKANNKEGITITINSIGSDGECIGDLLETN